MSIASRSLDAEPAAAPSVRRRSPGPVWALVARDWRITRSYRTALVSDLAFGFINLVMYRLISQTLRPRAGTDLAGAPSYFAFAAVGVALAVVLQAAISGLARRVREEQLTGTLETLLTQPISTTEVALGLAGFPFLFAVVRALAYLLLAGAFLGLSFAHTNWLGVLVSLLVSGLVFASIGIALAALVLVFKRAETVGSLSTVAISLLGGAVFPVSVLPAWLKPISTVIPTRFAFDAVRGAMFGTQSWLTPSLILLGMSAVMLCASLLLFSAALRIIVRQGTVSQY